MFRPSHAAERAMVIIGAGQSGGRAAETLRREGWRGAVVLFGSEELAPYERPPLSKAVLSGEQSIAGCALFPPAYLAEQEIDFRPGTTVVAIRRDRHEVVLSGGDALPYHRLLIATGAEPRRLAGPGFDRQGVFHLRSADQALRLAAELRPGRRIVIVGGGFIGLEVAASAALIGCKVTVVEVASRLVARAVPAEIASRLAARHAAAGVDIRLGRQVARIDGEAETTRVMLDDGTAIAGDAVLVAIGIIPRTELARATGLAVDNGIVVDQYLRTSDADIFAAGDACGFPHQLFDAQIRLESWKNADEQGRLAARNMLGKGERYNAVPWLWSDQYETTIQVAGMPGFGARAVERAAADGACLVFHLADDGRIVAASGIGQNGAIGRAVRLGQMMIERRLYPDPARLADPSVNLKLLLAAEAA